MSDTQIWGVTPAPGAPPKGVRAYLSRWGSAQPQPTLVSRISQELILRDFGRAPGGIVLYCVSPGTARRVSAL